jgi:predicted HNH restriction endonuclease
MSDICQWHLCTKIANKKFCSPQCKSKYYVYERRKRLKTLSIEYLGGKCQICGYEKCKDALVFHHLSPELKQHTISDGDTRSWERIKTELDKCILLCANCHSEVHANLHAASVLKNNINKLS